MLKLQTRLALFNLISKLIFTALFIAFLPYLTERINLIQTDNELINKREEVISLISNVGIGPFMTEDSSDTFGSYNILKEEFISLEKTDIKEDLNFIEVSKRIIDNETIDYRVLNYSFKIDNEKYLLEIGKSLSSILFTSKNIKKIILIFLISIILITITTDLYYTRKILLPMKMIINKLKSTSTPSLFDNIPVKTSTSDLRQLDQTIIDLMAKIDELFNKEKEITINISHELLTPVSVLRSRLENLLLQKNLDQNISEKIEESLRTLHRLKTLINSLLFIARIESRQYIKEDSFKITELLDEIIEELSPVSTDKKITMHKQFETDFIVPAANRSLIFSMIYNVVNNAIKNTQPEGQIYIKSHFKHNRLNVSIIDTGIGMEQSQIETLFSRFRKKLNPNEDSTGIGLAITKSIADFHKIDVAVISKFGDGTDFSFSFPENS
jgi:signal transduction histidine kinase